MDPPYQRKGRRWSKSDKQYLIDSILNGFDVPKFYVTEIAISDDFKYIADPSIQAAGLTLEELRKQFPAIAEEFENFNPIIMGVVTSDKRFIEELFVRLNRSRPLTGAEVRNAMPGPIPELVRQICGHPFFISNSRFPTGSGQDLNLAAKILMFEQLGELDNTKKENLDRFTSTASNAGDVSLSATVDRVLKNLDSMSEVFLFEDDLLGSEGPIPVYYWLIRSLPGDQHWEIRDFLAAFSSWLKTPDKVAALPPELVLDLESYAIALRSVNDKVSHEKRFSLLRSWFERWSNGMLR